MYGGRQPEARPRAAPATRHAPDRVSPAPALAPGLAHAGAVFTLQRLVGNAAIARLLQSPAVQRSWGKETYQVSSTDRTLHIDQREPIWGGTGDAGQHEKHRDLENRPRAILFETIAIEKGLSSLLLRLATAAGEGDRLWDVGLSVVLNQAYTPPTSYDPEGKATKTKIKSKDATSAENAKKTLDVTWQRLKGSWKGPPIQVVTAAWERRERELKKEENTLETVQSSVPYTTMRRFAATNPGAAAIEAALQSGHAQVWRKLGDDDMPIVDPNSATSPEMTKLAEVEEAGLVTNALVTFGYNLTTDGTTPPITGILQGIYRKEMELRDEIALLGAPMYPSEPTTFYRPIKPGAMNEPWQLTEKEKVGGSGQQLESAKLARALQKTTGYQHFTFHTVMVNTSAGKRNDVIVALLNAWWNNGTGDPKKIDPASLEKAINGLDQSALRENEYLDKVLTSIPGKKVTDSIVGMIRELVARYRYEAVTEACKTLEAALVQAGQATKKTV